MRHEDMQKESFLYRLPDMGHDSQKRNIWHVESTGALKELEVAGRCNGPPRFHDRNAKLGFYFQIVTDY